MTKISRQEQSDSVDYAGLDVIGTEITERNQDHADAKHSDLDHDPLQPEERMALIYLAELPDDGKAGLSLREIAERCGITSRQLARIRGRDRFQTELRALLLKRVDRALPQVLAAAIATASLVGKEGFQDRKLLLSMASLLPGSGRRGGFAATEAAEAGAAAALGVGLGQRLERTLIEAERVMRDAQRPAVSGPGAGKRP